MINPAFDQKSSIKTRCFLRDFTTMVFEVSSRRQPLVFVYLFRDLLQIWSHGMKITINFTTIWSEGFFSSTKQSVQIKCSINHFFQKPKTTRVTFVTINKKLFARPISYLVKWWVRDYLGRQVWFHGNHLASNTLGGRGALGVHQ